MARADWYGGLRWVGETDSIPASVAARVVAEAGEASDRMADTSLRGRDNWPHPNTLRTMDRYGLTDAEMPEFRDLKDLGFLPLEAANIIIRSRKGERK